MGWNVIERLDPDQPAPTLVWKDGSSREFTSLNQITRKDGLKRAVLAKAFDVVLGIPPQSFEDRERKPIFDEPVEGLSQKRVIIHQIVAADEYVVGLQVWIGGVDETPEPRPRTAGMLFTLNTFTVHNSRDTWMLRADSPESLGTFEDSDQFFNRVARFPDIGDVVDICSDAPTRSQLSSRVTLIHDNAHLVNLQIVAKRVGDSVFGLGHDITQWVKPQLDTITLMRSTGTVPTGRHTAVLAFRRTPDTEPAIVFWVTPPPSWLKYWDGTGPLERGQDGLIHPDDHRDLVEARTSLDAEKAGTVEKKVRLRSSDDSWISVPLTLTNYPSQETKLYIAEFASQ